MPKPIWVAGVDGCRAGWLVVLRDISASQLSPRVRIASSFAEILNFQETPAIIAVDTPIGLPRIARAGGRACDAEARTFLGPRRSSVFGVPARAAVNETDYKTACQVAFDNSSPPRKISKQSFFIFPKIRDVDQTITPAMQDRIIECHPEVAFARANNDTPLQHAKRLKPRGPQERIRILRKQGFTAQFLTARHTRTKDAAPDDFLDACICAWTAQRKHVGQAVSFPTDPDHAENRDARGLHMAIWS